MSHQVGLSYKEDTVLDMRYNPDQQKCTAADIVY